MEDMGIYNIHTLIDLLGIPEQVAAMSSRPLREKRLGDKRIAVETEDNFGMLLSFPGGVIATLYAAFAWEPEVIRWGHLAIIGDQAALEVRRSPSELGQYELILRSANGVEVKRVGHGLNMEHEGMDEAHVYLDIRDFILSILEKREPGASAVTACAALAVLDAAAASASARRAMPIQLDEHPQQLR